MIGRATALVAALFASAGWSAEPLSSLVEEQARTVYGNEVPPGSDISVMTTTGAIHEAVVLSAFWMDRKSGKFLANAVSESGMEHRIAGYAIVTVKVAVPTRKIFPGEVLSMEDLQIVDIPQMRLGSFAVTDPDTLIGKEVKSLLTPGRQIMAQAIREPLVVRRGQKVSIQFVSDRLELSAPGRALGDAHAGEELKVVNTISNTTVLGVARPDGTVEIMR